MRYLLTIIALIGVAHAQPLFHAQGTSGSYVPYTPPAITYDTVALNFKTIGSTNNTSAANWNNIPNATPTVTVGSLVFLANGANSGWSISYPSANSGNTSDNGGTYCAGATQAPQDVYRYAQFDGAGNKTYTISGLNNAKTYDLVFMPTRSTTNVTQTITSQSKSGNTTTQNQCTTPIKITGLVPSSGVITFVSSSNGSFQYAAWAYIIQVNQ